MLRGLAAASFADAHNDVPQDGAYISIVAGRFVDEAVLGVARRCGARAARARARPIGPTTAPMLAPTAALTPDALPLGNQIHQKSKYRQIGHRIVAGPSVP